MKRFALILSLLLLLLGGQQASAHAMAVDFGLSHQQQISKQSQSLWSNAEHDQTIIEESDIDSEEEHAHFDKFKFTTLHKSPGVKSLAIFHRYLDLPSDAMAERFLQSRLKISTATLGQTSPIYLLQNVLRI